MKIFSSFDTKLASELYDKEVTKFGDEKVLIVHRDPIYIRLKIILPTLVFVGIIILMMYVEIRLIKSTIISTIITDTGMIAIGICIILVL
jgi:hypothetical protein